MHALIRCGAHRGAGAALLLFLLLAPGVARIAAQETPEEAPALITGIELRREAAALELHFHLTAPTRYEVVGNPAKRVVVVKFFNALPGFRDGQQQFAYNDPLVEGIVFERLDDNTTWAKIRLRRTNVAFQSLTEGAAATLAVGLSPTAPRPDINLVATRLGRHEGASRLVLDLNRLPQYELQRVGRFYLIRLKGVSPGEGLRVQGEDERLVLLGAEVDGEDLLVRVEIKKPIVPTPMALTDPPRLIFDFTAVAAPGAPAPAAAEAAAARLPSPAPENVEALLEAVEDPVVRANYILAERAFRVEEYARASDLFFRVYEAVPEFSLGIRAFLRSSDAEYERLLGQGAKNFHALISNYHAGIRQAETLGYESELIPRALFNIGRSYQGMAFYFEANVHYEILQNEFPLNLSYTTDSYFYRGETFLATSRWDEAIADFRHFLEEEGEPALEGPAFYMIGDAFYNQEKYGEARREFDRARRLARAYPADFPLLLFHMGETYYENADFDTARQIYRTLLDRYPTRPYAKLVALRLGDFLVDEGKEAEALEVYRQVVAGAPLRIMLRGKMRIANIFAKRPFGDDYEKAIALFGEVIAEADTVPISQEAHLRRALTLTLHRRYQEAIDGFEKLREEYPESPYLAPNIFQVNIDENLKGLIDRHYRKGEFWEAAKVYTRYRSQYFQDFRFKITLFQIASAYHNLGLYGEALGLYSDLAAVEGHQLVPLVRYRTAEAYIERDDLARAEETLLQFIQDYEREIYRADVRLRLGEIYALGRRFDDAVNAFRLIVDEFEETENPDLSEVVSEAYYNLGTVYKEIGEQKKAADAFRETIANFHHPIQGQSVPEYVILSHFLIGDMQFDLGQDDEALLHYEDAIARYPDHDRTPWAWYQMGLIYRRRGDDAKALDTFNTLVDLAEKRPGELWESMAKDNQRELVNVLQFRDYLNQ